VRVRARQLCDLPLRPQMSAQLRSTLRTQGSCRLAGLPQNGP
jgi:hypothetical protein